jgi:hypothetical protein
MQPMIDGVQDKLSGAHSDLVVKVYGNDFGDRPASWPPRSGRLAECAGRGRRDHRPGAAAAPGA